MMRTLRELRERRLEESGFTLVEVLVAMVLLSIVIGLTTKSLIGAIDQQSNITQQTEAQNRNQVGIELVTRLLRQADYPTQGNVNNSTIITDAETNKIVFTSRLSSTSTATSACTSSSCSTSDTTTKEYVVALSGTTLKWGSAAATNTSTSPWTYPAASSITATNAVVYGVQNAAGASVCPANTGTGAVFRYMYINTTGQVAEYVPPLTSAQMGLVQFVEIDLYTQTQTGPQRPACVALTDQVELRNWL